MKFVMSLITAMSICGLASAADPGRISGKAAKKQELVRSLVPLVLDFYVKAVLEITASLPQPADQTDSDEELPENYYEVMFQVAHEILTDPLLRLFNELKSKELKEVHTYYDNPNMKDLLLALAFVTVKYTEYIDKPLPAKYKKKSIKFPDNSVGDACRKDISELTKKDIKHTHEQITAAVFLYYLSIKKTFSEEIKALHCLETKYKDLTEGIQAMVDNHGKQIIKQTIKKFTGGEEDSY